MNDEVGSMVSMTNKDFNRLLSASYKLSSSWKQFKMELQDQDSVEDQMDCIKNILVKYNNRKVEEELRHISSRKNNQPVICNGGIAHPKFFGCPRCGKDVGSYMITGDGPDEWSTHQNRFCSGCGLKIDWDGINFSDIMKV